MDGAGGRVKVGSGARLLEKAYKMLVSEGRHG